MWENRTIYNGLTVLPYDGGSYIQAPFEDCSKETYEAMLQTLKNIDLTMSPQFQKGFADVTAARDQLKLFKSKEAQNARNLLARIGCPGKGSGGRVGFFEGQNAQACADRGLIKLKTTDPKNLSPGDRRNFQSLTKTLQAGRFIKNFLIMSKIKLDDIDHQILDMLIENTRTPFTDIAKKLLISAGTVHVRVKKMEEYGLIKGSSLILDYDKLGYTFIAYVGLYIKDTSKIKFIIQRINEIPNVTVAHITTGKFNVFCKIRAKGTTNAKNIIFKLDEIEGVYRTESMISLEESINDKKRLMHSIFKDLD